MLLQGGGSGFDGSFESLDLGLQGDDFLGLAFDELVGRLRDGFSDFGLVPSSKRSFSGDASSLGTTTLVLAPGGSSGFASSTGSCTSGTSRLATRTSVFLTSKTSGATSSATASTSTLSSGGPTFTVSCILLHSSSTSSLSLRNFSGSAFLVSPALSSVVVSGCVRASLAFDVRSAGWFFEALGFCGSVSGLSLCSHFGDTSSPLLSANSCAFTTAESTLGLSGGSASDTSSLLSSVTFLGIGSSLFERRSWN